MSDAPENLMLVYLRRIDAKVDRVVEDLRDVKERMTSLELGAAGMRRDMAALAEADARLQLRFDRVETRLERIERRLDLAEA